MASIAHHGEDLEPEQTEGFKVGESKTIDEYQKLGRSQIPVVLFSRLLDGIIPLAAHNCWHERRPAISEGLRL